MAAQSVTSPTFILSTSDEPTLREAIHASPQEREMWLQAIKEEYEALDSKGTWAPDQKSRKQALPTHIVLKVKRDAAGCVERFKARIVAGGNHQQYGEDYFQTYAPSSTSDWYVYFYMLPCAATCVWLKSMSKPRS
jgi:hypothetical protein